MSNYKVVEFLTKGIYPMPKYACVPGGWTKPCGGGNVLVAYPDCDKQVVYELVRQAANNPKGWPIYECVVRHETDNYNEASEWISGELKKMFRERESITDAQNLLENMKLSDEQPNQKQKAGIKNKEKGGKSKGRQNENEERDDLQIAGPSSDNNVNVSTDEQEIDIKIKNNTHLVNDYDIYIDSLVKENLINKVISCNDVLKLLYGELIKENRIKKTPSKSNKEQIDRLKPTAEKAVVAFVLQLRNNKGWNMTETELKEIFQDKAWYDFN